MRIFSIAALLAVASAIKLRDEGDGEGPVEKQLKAAVDEMTEDFEAFADDKKEMKDDAKAELEEMKGDAKAELEEMKGDFAFGDDDDKEEDDDKSDDTGVSGEPEGKLAQMGKGPKGGDGVSDDKPDEDDEGDFSGDGEGKPEKDDDEVEGEGTGDDLEKPDKPEGDFLETDEEKEFENLKELLIAKLGLEEEEFDGLELEDLKAEAELLELLTKDDYSADDYDEETKLVQSLDDLDDEEFAGDLVCEKLEKLTGEDSEDFKALVEDAGKEDALKEKVEKCK